MDDEDPKVVEVRRWMARNCEDYQDCGETNATQLAEAAAGEFDLYIDDDGTIPEWVFELSATF